MISDETSPAHQPDADYVESYVQVFRMVCAASHRAAALASAFLDGLNDVLASHGGPTQTCSAETVGSPIRSGKGFKRKGAAGEAVRGSELT